MFVSGSLRRTLAYSARFVLSLGAALCVVAAAGLNPALAQQDANAASGPLEEVLVTARRRTETLLEVPMSVSAFSGDELARLGAEDLTVLTQTTPNVTFEKTRGTNSTLSAFIRGVGQQDPVAGFEAGVGIYVDDVYLNRPQAAVLDIYDVERIEVLRGPQGTLYGRNTIGGAIKYVTRRLGDEPEGKIRVSLGNYSQADAVLSGSMPLSDTFRVGGALARFTRDGFGDNLTLSGIENYNKDVFAVRGSAEWMPTDSFSLRFTGDYTEDESDPRQGHRLTVGNLSGAPILGDVFDTRAGLNNPISDVEAKGFSLTGEWTLSDAFTLKAIVSDRDDESFSPIDFDSLEADDLDVPVVYTNEQFSTELQLLFEGERVAGVAGLYFLDANAFNAFDVILGPTGDLLGLPGLNSFTLGNVDTETWSAFADFSYDLNDTVSLSVGGRYTSDERSSTVLRQTLTGGTSSYFGGTAVPIATTSDFTGSEKFTEFTPRGSVSWQFNDDANLYLSYSQGFKGGSFDPRGLTTAAPDLDGDGDVDASDVFEFMLFQPETVNAYELGLKFSAFADRMTAGVAVFLSDYKDVQIPGSVGFDSDGDGIVDSFAGITSNAADADIFGIEFEGRAVLAEDLGASGASLDLSWALGYIDAEYNEFIDAFGMDVADQRVFQNTPEWTASAIASYTLPVRLFNRAGALSLITTLSHRDDSSQFETPITLLDQDAFTLWDLSVVWEDDGGHWRAGLHGRNLTDEEYKVAGYNFPTLGLEGTVTAFYGDPLTVTATVEYNF